MTLASGMEWLLKRFYKEASLGSACRAVLRIFCLFLVLSVSLYPGLWFIGVQIHSFLTGSYVPGHHSVLLVNSPTEQVAKDIGRAIVARRLAASINIIPRTATMYYWKGEIQDTSEILMLVKTKTSRLQQIIDYLRSNHPYANPEVLSFPVEDGSLAYMKWMDEAIPDE
ncbi:protein CutA homolog isoform 1-T1 [Pholidichthys leucotaenia]